ncbi:MAG: hypothetical protein U0521_17375 [Anaerolineae bacterium]
MSALQPDARHAASISRSARPSLQSRLRLDSAHGEWLVGPPASDDRRRRRLHGSGWLRRVPSSGDNFSADLYGQNAAIGRGTHLLLVIADDNTIYYYVDRKLVGTLENAPQDGEVGIAVVNFEPNSTTCQYANFWLWEWEQVP